MTHEMCQLIKKDFLSARDQPGFMAGMAGSSVVKYVLMRMYNRLILEKTLTPISKLSLDKKTELFETAKDLTKLINIQLNKPQFIIYCKCLHVFTFIIDQPN